MAEIELVIKIPEEKYQGIINRAEEILDPSTFCSPRYLYLAVLDGIQLPKWHSDLIDRNTLRETFARDCITDCGCCDGVDECHLLLDAPAIIEADKEIEDADSD